jgi:serine/threonine protein kinase
LTKKTTEKEKIEAWEDERKNILAEFLSLFGNKDCDKIKVESEMYGFNNLLLTLMMSNKFGLVSEFVTKNGKPDIIIYNKEMFKKCCEKENLDYNNFEYNSWENYLTFYKPLLCAVVLIIEEKKDSLANFQICKSLKEVLEVDKDRLFVYGCILTLDRLQLFYMERGSNNKDNTFYNTGCVHVNKNGLSYLLEFLNQPLFFYGLGLELNTEYVEDLNGFSGRSGVVRKLNEKSSNKTKYVVKWYREAQKETWWNEVMLLCYLNSLSFFLKKGSVNPYNKEDNLPYIVGLDINRRLIIEPYLGTTICSKEGKSHLESLFSSNKNNFLNFISKLFSPLFRLLVNFEYGGIVHRDIRPSNITIEEDKLYLLDYGYCCPNNEIVSFSGGLSCASQYVLSKLSEGEVDFSVFSSDDRYSLIRTMIIVFNDEVDVGLSKLDRTVNIKSVAGSFKGAWSDFIIIPDFLSALNDNPERISGKIMFELITNFPELFNFKASKNENKMWETVLIPLVKKYVFLSSQVQKVESLTEQEKESMINLIESVVTNTKSKIGSVLTGNFELVRCAVLEILYFCIENVDDNNIVNELLDFVVKNYNTNESGIIEKASKHCKNFRKKCSKK